jgi:two-component system OmpR family response regulator
MLKILIIEDDETIAKLLSDYLKAYAEVTHIIYPLEALQRLDSECFDIIILDLTLPQMDGLKVCKMIRSISEAKIIISSARSDIEDKLYALENGADDYLPKPYDPRELYARIKILYARSIKERTISSRLFNLDTEASLIYKNGKVLDLTKAEYQIMHLFLTHEGKTFSRTDIGNAISSHRFDSGLESINVLVGRLRKKIESSHKNPTHIITVHGIGYRFSE